MQQVRKKSKELDHYLKSIISAVPRKLDNFIEGSDKTMTSPATKKISKSGH